MKKFLIVSLLLGAFSCTEKEVEVPCEPAPETAALPALDSLATALDWPKELTITPFSDSEITPSPACIAVSHSGAVYVGVDMMGSLGKEPGKGHIVKLIDCNQDGIVDSYTTFADVDNPRGIIVLDEKVFVLHTVFGEEGIATGMNLVVFEDKDGDGVADGPSKPLIEHISSPKFLQGRGTDHSTNGIRLGIDGWIYIAVGDFGFHDAVDREGTTLTMLGGGVVRVRPDGTEMEIYTHGLRNIYDVAIDPLMNMFTRDNTNDGGGWNIRFSHQIQSGEYGYPVLFKHFTEEILPALVDVGGGSGTGALFMDDARWPEQFNRVPMMADWGRNQLYIHKVTEDGSSYTQEELPFIKLPQITDLDVDGTGRLYLAAWDGAGYRGSPFKGFVVRAVPKDWTYEAAPNLKKASLKELIQHLGSGSAVTRLYAQQELLNRPAKKASDAVLKVAKDSGQPLSTRVAALYAFTQINGVKGMNTFEELYQSTELREHVIRAFTDRRDMLEAAPVDQLIRSLGDSSPQVRRAAIIALGRVKDPKAIPALLGTPVPSSFVAPEWKEEGPHADPNAAIVPAHLAVRALVNMKAGEACLDAMGSSNQTLALWALRYMHDPAVVNGLIERCRSSSDEGFRAEILGVLARLYTREAPYDGSWWWGTRPDTHGPYYKSVLWRSSASIKDLFMQEWSKGGTENRTFIGMLNEKNRMGITEFGGDFTVAEMLEEPEVDLEKIKNKKGQVGSTSIEDVLLAIQELPGDAVLGKTIFEQQGCRACHSLEVGEAMKGPFMGQIGSIMSRDQIAESILKPDASISQGFATVLIKTKDDKSYMGFVTEESAEKIVIRNIVGQAYTLPVADVVERKEMENSMMPEGLANALSYEEFASLVTFLSQQK
jgi:putative heme-binding domain-containing protein